jgi:hypothetical protein
MWTAKNSGRCDRSKLRYPSDLTDDEWSHVEAFGANGSPGEVKAALALHPQGMGIHRIPREAGASGWERCFGWWTRMARRGRE